MEYKMLTTTGQIVWSYKRQKIKKGIPDLLQALKIIPELHVQSIGDNLGIFAILVILLPVQEPVGDLELARVGHNHHQVIKLSSCQLTSSAAKPINTKNRENETQTRSRQREKGIKHNPNSPIFPHFPPQAHKTTIITKVPKYN